MRNSQTARILVVDDERPSRDLCRRLLERDGYDVQVADGGAAAMARLAQEPPDVVLLDVAMPGLDGFAVCRAIKQSPPTRFTPVVFVTGSASPAHRLKGIDAGADDFLTKPFDTEELRARVRSLVRMKRSTDDLESVEGLLNTLVLTIEARDPATVGHSARVSRLAAAFGRRLGLRHEQVAALRRAGYLHDIGKVAIPDSILRKPAPLSPSEFALVQRHPIVGEGLCAQLRTLAPVRPIIRSHHERRDGSGYPDGLRDEQVPLLAEVIAIADVFDALTSARSYRPARSRAMALEILKQEGHRGKWRDDLLADFICFAGHDALDPAC